MTDSSPSDAATLCVSCGLCCTGILFTNTKAEPEEARRIAAAGLEVDQVGERLQFRLPCQYNRDGCCTIYEERFTKCRTFRCALLKGLDAGDVVLPGALQTVAQAKTMVGRIAAKEPGAELAASRVPRLRAGAPGSGAGPGAAALWVETMALDLFLDRNFRTRTLIRKSDLAGLAEGGMDQ